MSVELYKKHRPKSLKDVVGQPDACQTLLKLAKKKKIPHALLFTGPSGCGKTTLARIIANRLRCGEQDFQELNSADLRGIETIRDIRSRMGMAPISGPCRVWLIDECHQLTKDAQTALLKMLEDTPKHMYFMLATTDPQKLIKTIQTRCTEIKVKALNAAGMTKLIETIMDREKIGLTEEVVERLVEVADGSARKALVILHQVLDLPDEDQQLAAIQSSDHKNQAIEIARALMNPRMKWPEMAKILKGVDEDAESLRHMILAYTTNVLLGSGKAAAQAYLVLNAFRDNFYDSKRAGLVAACYEVVVLKT